MVNARTVDCISLLIKEVSEKVTGSNPVLTTVSLGLNPGRSTKSAPLVELVDTPDLGSGAVRFESSSLSGGTMSKRYSAVFNLRLI